jgi:hypothetical protein
VVWLLEISWHVGRFKNITTETLRLREVRKTFRLAGCKVCKFKIYTTEGATKVAGGEPLRGAINVPILHIM